MLQVFAANCASDLPRSGTAATMFGRCQVDRVQTDRREGEGETKPQLTDSLMSPGVHRPSRSLDTTGTYRGTKLGLLGVVRGAKGGWGGLVRGPVARLFSSFSFLAKVTGACGRDLKGRRPDQTGQRHWMTGRWPRRHSRGVTYRYLLRAYLT